MNRRPVAAANAAVTIDNSMFAMKADKFKTALRTAVDGATKAQERFHTLLMAALFDAAPLEQGGHNNGEKFRQIIQALPDLIRKTDVRDWVHAHSNARIKTAKDASGALVISVKMLPLAHEDRKAECDFSHANANPFFKKIKAQGDAALALSDEGFAEMLARAVKQAEKARANGGLNLTPANLARLDALKDMASAAKPKAA